MTFYCYGEAIIGKGGIPVGGSDSSKLWLALTAEAYPIQLMAGSYWSGYSGEDYGLVMIPPGVDLTPNGTVTLNGQMGAVMTHSQLAGQNGTAAFPAPIWPGNKTAGGYPPVLPAGWSLCVVSPTAATNDFQVRVMGMELVKP